MNFFASVDCMSCCEPARKGTGIARSCFQPCIAGGMIQENVDSNSMLEKSYDQVVMNGHRHTERSLLTEREVYRLPYTTNGRPCVISGHRPQLLNEGTREMAKRLLSKNGLHTTLKKVSRFLG